MLEKINFRIEKSLKNEIEDIALNNGNNISDTIRELLKVGIEDQKLSKVNSASVNLINTETRIMIGKLYHGLFGDKVSEVGSEFPNTKEIKAQAKKILGHE